MTTIKHIMKFFLEKNSTQKLPWKPIHQLHRIFYAFSQINSRLLICKLINLNKHKNVFQCSTFINHPSVTNASFKFGLMHLRQSHSSINVESVYRDVNLSNGIVVRVVKTRTSDCKQEFGIAKLKV